jgi:hypothetical protein
MRNVVCLDFVGDGGARPNQRHLTFEDINELRQFVKTGPSQESADASDSGVLGQFVNAGFARNQLPHILFVLAASLSTKQMERNFKKQKGTPYCPILFCLKKRGPFEVCFIANATPKNKGERNTRAIRLPVKSTARFMARKVFIDKCEAAGGLRTVLPTPQLSLPVVSAVKVSR